MLHSSKDKPDCAPTTSTATVAAVASAYDPLADNKVPSPKSPVKPNPTLSSRKLLQQAAMTVSGNTMSNTDKPGLLWGGYVVTTPYWWVCCC